MTLKPRQPPFLNIARPEKKNNKRPHGHREINRMSLLAQLWSLGVSRGKKVIDSERESAEGIVIHPTVSEAPGQTRF